MTRIFPRTIQDKFLLSYILYRYITALQESPLQVPLSALAYDTRIPEAVFQRMADLRLNPDDAVNIHAEDFHILFSNVLFRYPTVKIWALADGEIYVEM